MANSIYYIYTKGVLPMNVKLRQVGNSKTLTVPANIKTTADEYAVKNEGKKIVFTPVSKHQNVFSKSSWKNYDYQKDIRNDPDLRPVKPVGKEVLK